jgi:protoporphyrinogen oxidase
MAKSTDSRAVATRELRAVDIRVVEIGATASGPGLPAIWTYTPDQTIPFYRLTRLECLSPELAPKGGTSILLEVSGELLSNEKTLFEILARLEVLDVNSIRHYFVRAIPHAYVLFLKGHRQEVARLRRSLALLDVFTAGRYGAWLYADIEMTLKSGVAAAIAVLSRLGKPNERRGSQWDIFA